MAQHEDRSDGSGQGLENPSAWSARRTIQAIEGSGLPREVAIVASAMIVYFAVRNITAGTRERAIANAEWLLRLQERLGLAWEEALQGAIIDSQLLVTLFNWIYIWGHWPVILPTAVALFLLRRPHYRVFRNALFLSGLVGFIVFALLPVAPPRLLDIGLVDTVTERSHAYRTLQPPGLTNQYAAMPSLHFGWNLALGIVLFHAFRSLPVRAFAVGSPIAMATAVVVTANHFVLDVVAGAALVIAAYAVAVRIESRRSPAATLESDGMGASDHPGHGSRIRGALRRRPPRR